MYTEYWLVKKCPSSAGFPDWVNEQVNYAGRVVEMEVNLDEDASYRHENSDGEEFYFNRVELEEQIHKVEFYDAVDMYDDLPDFEASVNLLSPNKTNSSITKASVPTTEFKIPTRRKNPYTK